MSPFKETCNSWCHVIKSWDEETVGTPTRQRGISWVWRCLISSGHVSLFIQIHIEILPIRHFCDRVKSLIFCPCSGPYVHMRQFKRGANTPGATAHIWIDLGDKIRKGLKGLYAVIQPCFYWWKQNREKWLKEDTRSLSAEGRNEWQNAAAGLSEKWNNVIVSLAGS